MTAPPEHEFESRTPTMLYRIQGPTERLLEATAVEAAFEPVPAIRPIPGAARPTTTDWMRAATRTEFLRGLCGISSTSSGVLRYGASRRQTAHYRCIRRDGGQRVF